MTPALVAIALFLVAMVVVAVLYRNGWYPPEIRGVNLDSDWLLRRLLPATVRTLAGPLLRAFLGLRAAAAVAVQRVYAVGRARLSPQYESDYVSDIGIIITVASLGVALLLSY